MYSRILVPLDGSDTAEAILPDIEELAMKLGAEVHLLQAVPSLSDVVASSHIAMDVAVAALEEDKKNAQAYLDGVAERLRAAGVNAVGVVAEGPAGRTILAHCRHADIQLIAMTSHGRSGIRRTLFGSIADEVMRESHLPVLMKRLTEDT